MKVHKIKEKKAVLRHELETYKKRGIMDLIALSRHKNYQADRGYAPEPSLIPHPHHTSPLPLWKRGLWGGSCYGTGNVDDYSMSSSHISIADGRGFRPLCIPSSVVPYCPIRKISVKRRGPRVKRFFVSEAQRAELENLTEERGSGTPGDFSGASFWYFLREKVLRVVI
jgi:hypothetical protein